MDEALKRIGETRGLKTRVARALGVSVSAISQWPRIPAEHLPMVEAVTGIPRQKLRPDIFVKIPKRDIAWLDD